MNNYKLTEEEIKTLSELKANAASAPVVTFECKTKSLSQVAREELMNYAEELLRSRGLPINGSYGINFKTWEIIKA